jgi:hypothetical protein
MEVTPFPGIFLCLSSVLICLWLGLIVLMLCIFSLSFVFRVGDALSLFLLLEVPMPKFPHLLFELLLDFDDMSIGYAQG